MTKNKALLDAADKCSEECRSMCVYDGDGRYARFVGLAEGVTSKQFALESLRHSAIHNIMFYGADAVGVLRECIALAEESK